MKEKPGQPEGRDAREYKQRLKTIEEYYKKEGRGVNSAHFAAFGHAIFTRELLNVLYDQDLEEHTPDGDKEFNSLKVSISNTLNIVYDARKRKDPEFPASYQKAKDQVNDALGINVNNRSTRGDLLDLYAIRGRIIQHSAATKPETP